MAAEAAPFEPVKKEKLHREIVKQILLKVINGVFKIGDRLPSERDLAKNLNVNRATVREALKELELLGLVGIRHGDGIYVEDYLESGNLALFREIIYMDEIVSYDILKNIMDVRRILVPEMAACAAENRTADELEELKKTALAPEDEGSILERDLKVHHIIARMSKNTFYIFILNFFNQLFREYGYFYFADPENAERSAQFHRDIYKAINSGNAARAKKIMNDILLYTERRVFDYYKKFYGLISKKGAAL